MFQSQTFRHVILGRNSDEIGLHPICFNYLQAMPLLESTGGTLEGFASVL